MTIKDLKEAIANLPDDGEVFYERIEDKFFEKNGWTTVKQKGEMYHNMLRYNNAIDSKKYHDREEYPNMTDEYLASMVKLTDQELEDCLEEYVPAFTPINYDKKNLYITAHY
jgi:hypothetical protein